MASPAFKTSDISLPVLQRTTSDRVTPAPLHNNPEVFQSSYDDDDLPLPAPPPELLGYYDDNDGQQQGYEQDQILPPPQPLQQRPQHRPPPLPPLQQQPPQLQQQPPPPLQQQPQQQQLKQQPQQQQLKQQQPEQFIIQQQHSKEDEAANRLQSKYAAPDNLLVHPPHPHPLPATDQTEEEEEVSNITHNMNTHVSIADTTNNKDLTVSAVAHLKERSRGAGSVSAFSDTSSDISDATTSAPSATSSCSVPVRVSIAEGATEDDIQQVDMFYRSQKTDVRVCGSLANMYLSAAKTLERMPVGKGSVSNGDGGSSSVKSPDPSEMSMEDWDFIKTGIPVLVLNTGEHIRSHKLSIILAEKGTGFSLWEDVVNQHTRYNSPHANFHTLSLSTDSSRLVGFSFDEANAAAEFAEAVRSLLPKPDDESIDKKKKKKKEKKEKKPKQKYKPPKKIDISQPCCFVHVTKLERPNVSLFPAPPSGAELSRALLRSRSQSSELSDYSTSTSEHG